MCSSDLFGHGAEILRRHDNGRGRVGRNHDVQRKDAPFSLPLAYDFPVDGVVAGLGPRQIADHRRLDENIFDHMCDLVFFVAVVDLRRACVAKTAGGPGWP